MGAGVGKPASLVSVDHGSKKPPHKPGQHPGSMSVIKVEGGVIAELGSQISYSSKHIPGSSTGTDFVYIPDVSPIEKKQNDDSHELMTQCLFVEPAKGNLSGGDFVYYVSNLNGQNMTT